MVQHIPATFFYLRVSEDASRYCEQEEPCQLSNVTFFPLVLFGLSFCPGQLTSCAWCHSAVAQN